MKGKHRWLLLGYPRAYRRERGGEILDTLLELNPPGRTRPTFRQAVNLIGHGMRCRLGLPASKSVVVWAVLTSVVCGLFVAAAATRLAWETARPLPGEAEAAGIITEVFPGHDLAEVHRSPSMFVVYDTPVRFQDLGSLLFGDGNEYELGTTRVSRSGPPLVELGQTLATAQSKLRATGWVLDTPSVRNAVECAGPPCDPATLPKETTLLAKRGDNLLEIHLIGGFNAGGTYISASLSRMTPAAVHPAGVIGGLIGALLAWLVFGWASTRSSGWKRITVPLFGVTMFMWWAPVLWSVPYMVTHHLGETHYRWHPLWEWIGQPVMSLFFVLGTACALVSLAIAALPVSQPARLAEPSAG